MPDIRMLAIGGGPEHFGMLGDTAVQRWTDLQDFTTSEWKRGTPEAQRLARRLSGNLDKLAAVMLAASRLRQAHDNLIAQAQSVRQQAEVEWAAALDERRQFICYGAIRGAIICADFESLLFQARASLDSLARTLGPLFKNPASGYRQLAKILRNAGESSQTATQMLSILKLADNWLPELLVSETTMGSLRDVAAHCESVTGMMDKCFAFYFLTPARILLVDCELGKFPVFLTTQETVQHVSHVVLNCLSILASMDILDFSDFECEWKTRSVVVSRFVKDESDGAPAGEHFLHIIRRMAPDGVDTEWRNIDPALLEHGFDLPNAVPR